MDLGSLVSAALIPAIVPILLAALSRAGALASARPGELRYSPVLRWFSLLLALVPPAAISGLLILQRRPLRPDEWTPVVALLLFFPTLCAPVLLEFFRVRHDFNQEGFTFRSPWSKHRHFAWADVTSVKWGRFAKWLDIRTRDGLSAHVSPWLPGLEPFADLALDRIPSEAFAGCAGGRAALQVMSAGAGGDLVMSALAPEHLLATLLARKPKS